MISIWSRIATTIEELRFDDDNYCRLKLIYVIVALETQAHIVAEAEKSWNIFRHVPGRYSRILSYRLRCSSIHILGGAWVSFRNTSLAAYKKIVPFFPLAVSLLKLLASYKPNTSVLWRKQSINAAGLTISVKRVLLLSNCCSLFSRRLVELS